MYIYICVCVYKSEKEEGTRGAEFSEARFQPRKSLKYTHTRERRKKYSLTLCDPGNNNINNYATRKSIAKRGPTFIKDKENMFCSMALFSSSSSSFSQSFCEHACVCWRVCVFTFFFSLLLLFFFFFLLFSSSLEVKKAAEEEE